jgi:hypothetical protein
VSTDLTVCIGQAFAGVVNPSPPITDDKQVRASWRSMVWNHDCGLSSTGSAVDTFVLPFAAMRCTGYVALSHVVCKTRYSSLLVGPYHMSHPLDESLTVCIGQAFAGVVNPRPPITDDKQVRHAQAGTWDRVLCP